MLKPYMGFSRSLGAPEGAVLIFARTAREAKRISWGRFFIPDICDEYIDYGVRLIRNGAHLMKLATSNQPHVIESPPTCPRCELWGGESMRDSDGPCCEYCMGE